MVMYDKILLNLMKYFFFYNLFILISFCLIRSGKRKFGFFGLLYMIFLLYLFDNVFMLIF